MAATLPTPTPTPAPDHPTGSVRGTVPALQEAQRRAARWLAAHSVAALRISLGLVITGFASLKYVPGASPAAELAMQTTERLTFGLVGSTPAVVATALVETVVGLTLLTGRFMKPGIVVMAGWLVGILSPVVLFPTQMFPDGLPTLAAQYVLKDVILVAAAMVVAATTLGARMVAPEDYRRPTR